MKKSFFYEYSPFIWKGYGNSGYWCWISINQGEAASDALMLTCFYIFCWLAILYNIAVTLYIRRHLQHLRMLKVDAFYERIKYFPIMLTIFWTFPSVNRILQMAGRKAFIPEVLHIIFESSYGFCNMMLYAMNPAVKSIIKAKVQSFSRSGSGGSETINF